MLLRGTCDVHHLASMCSEPIPMRKPPTGEPCAGEPHARFGGRGRRKPFPTPIGVWRSRPREIICVLLRQPGLLFFLQLVYKTRLLDLVEQAQIPEVFVRDSLRLEMRYLGALDRPKNRPERITR